MWSLKSVRVWSWSRSGHICNGAALSQYPIRNLLASSTHARRAWVLLAGRFRPPLPRGGCPVPFVTCLGFAPTSVFGSREFSFASAEVMTTSSKGGTNPIERWLISFIIRYVPPLRPQTKFPLGCFLVFLLTRGLVNGALVENCREYGGLSCKRFQNLRCWIKVYL